MKTYSTSEAAAIIGIHPNTVRLYEEAGLIPAPARAANGYRIFTDYHIAILRLARTAFQIEVLQNGLRKKIVEMVKVAAAGNIDGALRLTQEYLSSLQKEQTNAEEAIEIVQHLLSNVPEESSPKLKRKDVSDLLHISMDTLRNWEMNGLLVIRRMENGYRVYTQSDIRRLKIIRSLRCASYSLEAILRMLNELSSNPRADIREVLNTPCQMDEITYGCDKLIHTLQEAEKNALSIIAQLTEIKNLSFN